MSQKCQKLRSEFEKKCYDEFSFCVTLFSFTYWDGYFWSLVTTSEISSVFEGAGVSFAKAAIASP